MCIIHICLLNIVFLCLGFLLGFFPAPKNNLIVDRVAYTYLRISVNVWVHSVTNRSISSTCGWNAWLFNKNTPGDYFAEIVHIAEVIICVCTSIGIACWGLRERKEAKKKPRLRSTKEILVINKGQLQTSGEAIFTLSSAASHFYWASNLNIQNESHIWTKELLKMKLGVSGVRFGSLYYLWNPVTNLGQTASWKLVLFIHDCIKTSWFNVYRGNLARQ